MAVVIPILIILCLAALYLWLIMPRVSSGSDMALVFYDYAHRGLFDNRKIPENSIGAFRKAMEKGVGMELDLQLTKDGRVVVFHDYTLERMCGKKVLLSSLTWEELKQERLLGTEYGIPLFEEVLNLVDGRVPLLIELKGEDKNDELCWKTAPLLDAYSGEFCLESFNPLLLRWFVKHRPDMLRGQLVTNTLEEQPKRNKLVNFFLTYMLLNFLSRPDFIACDGRYQKGLSFFVCRKIFKTPFFMWTVKKKELLVYNHRRGDRSIFEGFEP